VAVVYHETMHPLITPSLNALLLLATEDPEKFAWRCGHSHWHLREALMGENRGVSFLPLPISHNAAFAAGWSGLGAMCLAHWLIPTHFNPEVGVFNHWLTKGGEAPLTREEMAPHWDRPMAWGGAPESYVTVHGLWGMAQMTHLLAGMKVQKCHLHSPQSSTFMDFPLIVGEDLKAWMHTAMTVLAYPHAPKNWKTEVAELLAVVVMDDSILPLRDATMQFQREALHEGWLKLSVDQRFDHYTKVLTQLTFEDERCLVSPLATQLNDHQPWLALWEQTIREARLARLDVDDQSVAVHLNFLGKVLRQAKAVGQKCPMAENASIVDSLYHLAPQGFDPRDWQHRYEAIVDAGGQRCEPLAIESLNILIAFHTARVRADKGQAAKPAENPSTRARHRP
jgi:hypothetical protein